MSAMFVSVPPLTVLLFIGCLVLVGASALIGILTILAFYFMQVRDETKIIIKYHFSFSFSDFIYFVLHSFSHKTASPERYRMTNDDT